MYSQEVRFFPMNPRFHKWAPSLRRAAALAAATALLVGMVQAATTLGYTLRQDSIELSATATLTHGQSTGTASGGGQQTENILTYTPDSTVRPVVAFGSTLYGRSDANYVAQYLAGRNLTPVAAVNGGFFSMSTGVPMDLVLTEGILRSSGDNLAVGFRADGSTIMGDPKLQVQVLFPNGRSGVANYNKTVTKGNGLVVYSQDFDTKTKNTLSSYNVVLDTDSATLSPGQTVTGTVTAIVEDTASCTIPTGDMVVSMATESDYQYTLTNDLGGLKVGDTVQISCTMDSAWSDVVYALGCDEPLVQNGQAMTSFVLNTANKRAARTAVGVKADGTLVLYTVDGAQSGYSAGITLPELAQRMVELGCVTALNLDGGGSTTYVAQYPGSTSMTTINKPSDGQLRRCANFIFLVKDTQPAGEAVNLHLYPWDGVVLAGGRLAMTVKATDSRYTATTLPELVSYSATGGTIDERGIFTAGAEDTTATVTATGGNAYGARNVRVITSPSAITVENESTGKAVTSISVAAGQSLDLTAAAKLYNYTVTAQDDCYQWTVTDGLGVIDGNGKFTAAELTTAASGTITCTAGDTSASIAVTVAPLPPEGAVLEGLEPGFTAFSSGTGLNLSSNSSRSYVRYGTGSLRASYDLSKADAAASSKAQVTAQLQATLPAKADHVGLWIYGDNSGNSFSLRFTDGTNESSLWVTQLNFTGWKYVTAAIPAGATSISGLAVTAGDGATTIVGTVYVDQIVATSGEMEDTTPPSLTASVSGTTLTVSASESGSGVTSVTVSIDGKSSVVPLSGGQATVALPTDGQAHQVRITAADQFGNLSSQTVSQSGTLNNPFSDLDGHWSADFVAYCNRQGILSGSTGADGKMIYRPDDSMTRQEFTVALIRFLGVDSSQYADTTLPFADSGSIASWAMNDMKAAYALGLVTGSSSNGQLLANPTSTITRQEAMTILGRTQPMGYGLDPLTAFPDSGKVGGWARDYIAAMVTRGIISGSNGKLDPNGTVTRAQVAKMLYNLY